jgi:hypothetical protein
MQIDWSISFGSIIQVLAILGGGLLVLVTMRSTITVLQRDVNATQSEIKKMGDILTKMAVAESRLDNTDTRLTNVERDIRDLRRGEGFIRGAAGIEHEYPESDLEMLGIYKVADDGEFYVLRTKDASEHIIWKSSKKKFIYVDDVNDAICLGSDCVIALKQ